MNDTTPIPIFSRKYIHMLKAVHGLEFRLCVLPKAWTRSKKKIYSVEEAKEECKSYLDTQDRRTWPLLLGMHWIMDELLKQRFMEE